MAYADPMTWSPGDKVTVARLNQYLRDNIDALKNPPRDIKDNASGIGDMTTTSASFVDVSTTYFQVAITTTVTADILVGGSFYVRASSTATARTVSFDIMRNGTSVTGGTGFGGMLDTSSARRLITILWMLPNVAAGTHTIKLRWNVSGDTATIFSNGLNTQWWAREIS